VASELDRLPRTLSLAVHELRTPLAVASGYLRMLLREQAGAVTDPQRKMLEETAKACARMGTLIAEMSELQKVEAGDVTVPGAPFDLAALIVELGGREREGEDRGVHLQARVAGPVMVTGDRVRLAAALSALLHAALQERDEPGVIVVECSRLSDTNQAWAIVTIGDETVTRSLLDAARDTPPYFDEWREGLGLALPVGRRVIEAHGGALWSLPIGAPRAGSALRLPVAT
jgi:signal transduction histidine kinase